MMQSAKSAVMSSCRTGWGRRRWSLEAGPGSCRGETGSRSLNTSRTELGQIRAANLTCAAQPACHRPSSTTAPHEDLDPGPRGRPGKALSSSPVSLGSALTCSLCALPILQPLDFETRRSYSFRVEATNTLIDPAYLRRGPFKDVASVRVAVQDAPEPPAFTQDAYHLTVLENKAPGTLVGRVSASDLDSPASPIR